MKSSEIRNPAKAPTAAQTGSESMARKGQGRRGWRRGSDFRVEKGMTVPRVIVAGTVQVAGQDLTFR